MRLIGLAGLSLFPAALKAGRTGLYLKLVCLILSALMWSTGNPMYRAGSVLLVFFVALLEVTKKRLAVIWAVLVPAIMGSIYMFTHGGVLGLPAETKRAMRHCWYSYNNHRDTAVVYEDLELAQKAQVDRDHDGRLVVAFRGTVDHEITWKKTNFNAKPVDGLHGGFVEALNALLEAGLPDSFEEEILVTGHSLGGGIALLYANMVKAKGVKVITFAMPPICMPERSKEFRAIEHYRVYNPFDIVPFLGTGLYVHTGTPVIVVPPGLDFFHHDTPYYMKAVFADMRDHFLGSVQFAMLATVAVKFLL
jgi:hypothetical protein